MTSVFISYRRGDSAGHAGRLFDRLKDRLGAEHVFMDVTDLRPGQDFVAELDQALAQSNCLLAVIGPSWLDATDTSGRRRIDDPDDLVCREIATALRQGSAVIPVLVHGARMPSAGELPPALQPLARRQAIDISDERWDSDFADLLQVLAAHGNGAATAASAAAATPTPPPSPPPTPSAPPKPTSSRRRWAFSLMALLLVVALLGAAWLAQHSPGPSAVSSDAGNAPANTPTAEADSTPTPSHNAKPQPAFAITLPAISEVRFRTNRAQVVVSLLAIRLEPRDSSTQVLTLLLRMLNLGPYDEAFGSDQFRLLVGEQTLAPSGSLISAVEASAAKEANLRFVVPATATQVALAVQVNNETTRLPIPLTARTAIRAATGVDDFGRPQPARVVDTIKTLPAAINVGQRLDVGGAAYHLAAAQIERDTVEKASLILTIRCTAPAGVSSYFGSSSVRLWVDGVPRAPSNFVNLAIDPRDSKQAQFIFDLALMPRTLEVGIRNGDDSARVVLAVGELRRSTDLYPGRFDK